MSFSSRNGDVAYLIPSPDDGESRPQLISRHSSSLPVTHRDNKKKALSRRSRSASPCIKKTHSTCSGNATTILPQTKRKICRDAPTHSMQLPIIKKQPSQCSAKSYRASRNSLATTKQRVQVLGDHRKLKRSSVWEQISAVQGDILYTDVNSNVNYVDGQASYRKPTSYLQGLKRAALHYEGENLAVGSQHQKNRVDDSSVFDILPLECKLIIFSYLKQLERGHCMFVSKQWYHLNRLPQLWRVVNLREFVLCYGHDVAGSCNNQVHVSDDVPALNGQCSKVCYGRYMRRIDSYISFLIDLQPLVRRIIISFDLVNDNWMARVDRLFRHVNFRQLEYADIDWDITPVKPTWLDISPMAQLRDIAYATRRRQRFFLRFLEEYVSEMPNLSSLITPFGWSERAMWCLKQLQSLRCLVLKKYTVFCSPSQEAFDQLAAMSCLEQLLIEVWISTSSTQKYTLSSGSLKYLDLSQCRDFYLQRVNLPSLQVLKIEKNGGSISNRVGVPCLQEILCQGAPKLTMINHVDLTKASCSEIELLFRKVCPCKRHDLG